MNKCKADMKQPYKFVNVVHSLSCKSLEAACGKTLNVVESPTSRKTGSEFCSGVW